MIMKTPHIDVYRIHLVLIRGKLISLTLISKNQSIISISSLEKKHDKGNNKDKRQWGREKNNIHYLINMSKSWLFLENEKHTTQTSSYFDQEEKGDGTNEWQNGNKRFQSHNTL